MYRPSILEQDWMFQNQDFFISHRQNISPMSVSLSHRFKEDGEARVVLSSSGIRSEGPFSIVLNPDESHLGPLFPETTESQDWSRWFNKHPIVQVTFHKDVHLEIDYDLDSGGFAYTCHWVFQPEVQVDVTWHDRPSPYMTAIRHNLLLSENSQCQLTHYHHNEESVRYHEVYVRAPQSSRFVHLGAVKVHKGMTRISSHYELIGQLAHVGSYCGASTNPYGVFDWQVVQTHRLPSTQAETRLHALAQDQSKVFFRGLIRAEKEAVHTVSSQSHKTLVQHPSAHIFSAPRLEVLPSAVDCRHGSATGMIDEEALLYLKMRGWTQEEALQCLQQAFLEEAFPLDLSISPTLSEKIKFLTSPLI